MTQARDRAELTSVRTKLFYGAGSIAFGVKDNGFQTILLPFYNLVLHLPPQWVGAALAIAMCADAVLDPVIGHLSDNLRTRWGRRHPLMYASALPVAVSYLLLWNPPALSQTGLFIFLVIAAIIVRSFITCFEIPSAALVPELTDDYDERTRFLAYRIFFAWYGGMTMVTLAYFVFLRSDAAHSAGQLNPAGYHSYGITAAVIMCAAILISALGTHRFIPLFRKPEARRLSLPQYGREMLTTLKNRPFLILMAGTLFTNLATGLVFALNFYIGTYFWGLSSAQMGVLSLAIFIAVLAGFFIAPPVSERLGKRLAAITLFGIGAVVSATPIVLGLLNVFAARGSGELVALLFSFSVAGSALTIGSSVMINAMIADVVEASELQTGRRSEGLFFAGMSFQQKAVSGLGLLASGLLLWGVGFPSNAVPGAVPADIIHRFALVYLITVGLLYTIGFGIIARFPIDRRDHEVHLAQLAAEAAMAVSSPSADAGLDGIEI